MKRKYILYSLIVLLIAIQFFQTDKTAILSIKENHFVSIEKASPEIENLLQQSCYDCHSYTVHYPWYSYVAPVSWWVKHHVNEGLGELNLSTWNNYSAKKREHKLKEMIEEIEEGEMPLSSYTLIHANAKLTATQKAQLVAWLKETKSHYVGE